MRLTKPSPLTWVGKFITTGKGVSQSGDLGNMISDVSFRAKREIPMAVLINEPSGRFLPKFTLSKEKGSE
jgi:hypothetical protein